MKREVMIINCPRSTIFRSHWELEPQEQEGELICSYNMLLLLLHLDLFPASSTLFLCWRVGRAGQTTSLFLLLLLWYLRLIHILICLFPALLIIIPKHGERRKKALDTCDKSFLRQYIFRFFILKYLEAEGKADRGSQRGAFALTPTHRGGKSMRWL